MSKKLLAMLLALVMIIGCVSAMAEEPVKLTLWTFQELHLQLYKDQLEKYNAQTTGPKLEIDMQVYPYEDLHSKLTIALQTGEGAPDISDIEINMFANYLKGDIQLAAMNEYVEPIKDKLVMARLDNYAREGSTTASITTSAPAPCSTTPRSSRPLVLITRPSRPGTTSPLPASSCSRRLASR